MVYLNEDRPRRYLDDPDDQSVDARSQQAGYHWRSSALGLVDSYSWASIMIR